MIFAKLPSGRHPESRWAWVKSRFEINGVIAVLAAVLVYGGVHLIGLTANHEMRTLFLIIIASFDLYVYGNRVNDMELVA